MSSNCKVKGLLKGLRFISRIFDGKKEPKIEIGHPTDVKHVGHIGLDGHHPENSSASLMNELESIGLSSGYLDLKGCIHCKGPHNSGRQITEDLSRGGSSSFGDFEGHERDLSRFRRQSTGDTREAQAKEKSDKPRQPKKLSTKHSNNSSFYVSKSIEDVDSFQFQGNNDNDLPPKKSGFKLTSKDGSIGLDHLNQDQRTRIMDHPILFQGAYKGPMKKYTN